MRLILTLLSLLLPLSMFGAGLGNPGATARLKKPTASGPSFPSSGLVHYYAMEEVDFDTRDDSVGTQHLEDGGSCWVRVAGKRNFGAQGSGCGDLLTTAMGFSLGTTWTIAGWFKFADIGDSQGLADQLSGSLTIGVSDSGGPNAFAPDPVFCPDNIPFNTFGLIVVTYASGTLKVSANGGTFESGATTFTNPSDVFRVGDAGGGHPIFVDELGIWNRALTQQEVTDLYNGGAGVFYTP